MVWVNVLRGRRPITRYLHVGITSMGSPASYSRSRTLQTPAVPRADRRDDRTACFGSGRWVCVTSQLRTVQSTKGQGSKVPYMYLGFRPADDLSVEFEGWATLCRIALVERALTQRPPPWRSVRAEAEYSSAPLQVRNNLSIAVSTVTGRSMLPSGSTTTNYYK